MNNPFIIGITGSYGKTSCAYTLHEYFKSLGYSSCLLSSNKLEFPNSINNAWNNEIKNKNNLDYYLYQADGSDFLVIEVHEQSLKNGVYDTINFDCKILVNFESGYNKHRSQEEYLELKKQFFNNGDCVKVINKNIDSFNAFNTEDAIIFSTKEYDGCDVYPLSKKLQFKNSQCVVMVGDERIEINSHLNSGGYSNLITVIATLYALEMFDKDSFVEDYLANNPTVKGRYELHSYGKKNVIVDSGNGRSLKNFVTETSDIKDYKVKGLVSVAGGLSDDLYEDMVSKGFVSLNKYLVADPVVRRNCLTFGGNLYKACHKLAVFRDDAAFNEVVDEVGAEAFLDLSNNTLSLPESIVEEMIDVCIMLGTDDLTRNPKYCKNFWWRSIPTIKGYFTIYYDNFLQICDALKTLNNENLSACCDYVKEMIDYTRSQYRQFGDSLSEQDIQKIYLTMNNSNDHGNMLELEMYKTFFKQPVEIFSSRQKALQAMVKDSQDYDILYIAGRGDNNEYLQEDGTYAIFTDSEYVDKLFNEVNTHDEN